MKKILLAIIISINAIVSAQEVDIITPKKSTFNAGQNIEGFVKSSINEPTGKVNFSVPVTKIASRTVYYDVSLNYNGNLAFDEGSYTNKYMPTSTVGVGFKLNIPRVIVDNKNTAAKDDDVFYLQNGTSSTKLNCFNKIDPGNVEGDEIWEFHTESYSPWKVNYYKSHKTFTGNPVVVTETPLDYWVVTNEEGAEYIYGKTQNSRENLVAWGNWMGNSIKTGGARETIAWNLTTIRDQWNNNIQFEYEIQGSTIGGVHQTEAAYLKKITSSTGESVRFSYTDKSLGEIYEPHTEQTEPDAYQERYEKKYLQQIRTYNSNNQLIYNYNFAYSLINNSSAEDQKRYLQNITQENANGEFLPGQHFEYYTTGDFKGGIKKVTYPSGGSVNYEYNNKYLFTNEENKFGNANPKNTDYYYYSIATRDKYALRMYHSPLPVNGKHSFQVIRHFWNGQSWIRNGFDFPYTIANPSAPTLQNFYTVFGDDFYAFLHVEGFKGRLDLFHLESDGVSWDHKTYTNINIGAGIPKLLKGDKFVAIGTHHIGNLHTYTWDNNQWQSKTIYQGNGQYYYGATNNYVLSLDEDGGLDMITNIDHEDNYYMHYLDISNIWKTKSWSAKADPYIAGIEKPSYFYPDNAMSGFVADDNPEFFLRWDKDYNLQRPDNVLGTYDDTNPIISTYTGMFTLQNSFYQYPFRYARFNGLSWNVSNLPESYGFNYAKPTYGEDILMFQSYRNNRHIGYAYYDPNSNFWIYDLQKYRFSNYQSGDIHKLTGIVQDFMIAGNEIYLSSNTSRFAQTANIVNYDNVFTHTDGLSHGFVELASGSYSPTSSRFYYKDKKTNQLNYISLGAKFHTDSPPSFAGRTPFMNPKTMWLRSKSFTNPNGSTSFTPYLHRVIDDKLNNPIYDIVVGKVKIDNNNGEVRETVYTYNAPKSSPNNETTFYGNVTVENKGFGTASIGKIEKKYNNGSEDVQMAGVLLEERIKDTSNNTVRLLTNTWTKFKPFSKNYTLKLTKQEEETIYNGKTIKTTKSSSYAAPHYFPSSTSIVNSKGQTEKTEISYAIDRYPFMNDRNLVSQPYEEISKIDGKVVSVNRTIWIKGSDNKIFASETWSGLSANTLRKNYEVTKMNDYGQIIETTNGKGQYNSILFGYNYRFPVATLSNVGYNTVINNLDVSLSALQNLNNTTLKGELSKLYDRLSTSMIDASIYDIEGKIVTKINQRQEELNYFYDSFNRLDYVTDTNNNVLKKNIYNYKVN
ncbi:hypothetical protein [Aquimarina sp. 2304DJ70-9]|uniref:hypothetical protein n=1 Tax=Aquimarina penaris TaxID=3231044 RepID=UPI00346352B2